MKILMCTNTYKPHVGGVAKSVEAFSVQFRKLGHQVLIVAPEFPDSVPAEDEVRVLAIQNFNGSDFSVQVPVPFYLSSALEEFQPDIIHSHHPFLLGDSAQRLSASANCPLVFSHHTMYEHYTHYVPGDSETMKQFVIELSTRYANLCDYVIAPSESIAEVLKNRGVKTPIAAIPTGVELDIFKTRNRAGFRSNHNIPKDTLVIGHIGRLAPEKNLEFLSRAVASYIKKNEKAHFLVVGDGPSTENIESIFNEQALSERLHLVGRKTGQDLIDAYHAMDLFVFASKSETQGMVLAEAMASGLPVVAIDAPGVREIVKSGYNGIMLENEEMSQFVSAISSVFEQSNEQLRQTRRNARQTAKEFSLERCANKALNLYQTLIGNAFKDKSQTEDWLSIQRVLEKEWQLIVSKAQALNASLMHTSEAPDTIKSNAL